MASWILYGFEKADLLQHGWNLFDVTITDKGRRVLAALDRFSDPHSAFGPDDGDGDDAADAPGDVPPPEPDPADDRLRPRFRFEP